MAVLGGAAGFAESLAAQAGVEVRPGLDGAAPFDVIVFFSPWRADLESELGELREHMAPACGLWIAWPKRAARVPTDMSDAVVREVVLAHRPGGQQGLRDRRGLVRPPPGDQARAAC